MGTGEHHLRCSKEMERMLCLYFPCLLFILWKFSYSCKKKAIAFYVWPKAWIPVFLLQIDTMCMWWWCFLISIFAEYIHSIYITGDGQRLLLWKCWVFLAWLVWCWECWKWWLFSFSFFFLIVFVVVRIWTWSVINIKVFGNTSVQFKSLQVHNAGLGWGIIRIHRPANPRFTA